MSTMHTIVTNKPRLVVTNEEEDEWDVPEDYELEEVPELEWHSSDDLIAEANGKKETGMETPTGFTD